MLRGSLGKLIRISHSWVRMSSAIFPIFCYEMDWYVFEWFKKVVISCIALPSNAVFGPTWWLHMSCNPIIYLFGISRYSSLLTLPWSGGYRDVILRRIDLVAITGLFMLYWALNWRFRSIKMLFRTLPSSIVIVCDDISTIRYGPCVRDENLFYIRGRGRSRPTVTKNSLSTNTSPRRRKSCKDPTLVSEWRLYCRYSSYRVAEDKFFMIASFSESCVRSSCKLVAL